MTRDGGPVHYSHHQSVDEILSTLKSVVDSELLKNVTDANWFSLEADEATDVSNKSILMVYIRYVFNILKDYCGGHI